MQHKLRTMKHPAFTIIALVLSLIVSSTEALTYTLQDLDPNRAPWVVDVTQLCREHFSFRSIQSSNDPVDRCILNEPVLQPFLDEKGYSIRLAMEFAATGRSSHALCVFQESVCKATDTFQSLTPECSEAKNSCRSALRHLHKMMFVENGEQVCNNFARKSLRGFFHDFMSNGIDGSILSENDLDMNLGMCRWTQYINVLSDETGCDPGTITNMAGQLGYLACGVDIYNMDSEVRPSVTANRPYTCRSNFEGSNLWDPVTGQRKEEFEDAVVAESGFRMEEFWYHANEHTHKRPDGEIEYSAEASAAAHAIGRVTCPIPGKGGDPNSSYKPGFFHKQRANPTFPPQNMALPNPQEVNAEYWQATRKMTDTQCFNPSRISTPTWQLLEDETDFNSEFGYCFMPTQFLGTVFVGGIHRVPRWVAITEESKPPRYPRGQYNARQACRREMMVFIPSELKRLNEFRMPQSNALSKFEAIAFDKVDSIDSAWDSCVPGCEIDIMANRLCGGPGLREFTFENPTSPAAPTPRPTPAPTPSPTPQSNECSVSNANLVCNGSFEMNSVNGGMSEMFSPELVPGWSSLHNSICLVQNRDSIAAADGVNYVEIDCVAGGRIEGIYQDILTERGQEYNLSFMMRARDAGKASSEDEGVNVSCPIVV